VIGARFCCRLLIYEVLAQPNRTRECAVALALYSNAGFGDCVIGDSRSESLLGSQKNFSSKVPIGANRN